MGYTHYFTQRQLCTAEQWENITRAFKEVITIQLVQGDPLPIQEEHNVFNPPVITDREIYFNGIGKHGYESFVLESLNYEELSTYSSNFCKTNNYPYDVAVTVVLILAHHFAPDVWDIRSDGDADDWADGLRIVQQLIPEAKLPPLV